MIAERLGSSFRDPSGFIFIRGNEILRQVNHVYQAHYDRLISSGLYAKLTQAGMLIPHEELSPDVGCSEGYKTIRPQRVPFISYPYEWSFSQLKDAALTTLTIQKMSLECGMSLKDCSAYNIQFISGRPVFIDTLSFEIYTEGRPWTPYRQFCQHFLAPLALMSRVSVQLNQLLRVFIDGVPLDLASSLLPWNTRLSFSLGMHIHMHAKSQRRYADTIVQAKSSPRFSKTALLGMITSLEAAIRGLRWAPEGTEWVDYYQDDSYTDDSLAHKRELVSRHIGNLKPGTVWDLGANTGVFSRVAASSGAETVSFDIDPACVELNYRAVRQNGEERVLPLLLDLTNPSPGIGWDNAERDSIAGRGPADLVMALALIHHLAISNNVPLEHVARFMSRLCRRLIIEFVPKSDPKVLKLLATREDVFPSYTIEGFEKAFGIFFETVAVDQIRSSERVLYVMETRQ